MSNAVRVLTWLTACVVSAALLLFAIDVYVTSQAQKQLIASKADQIDSLRARAKEAGVRADDAASRADAVTHIALAGIQTISCTQYRLLEVTSAFARLVVDSPNSSPAQKAGMLPLSVAPQRPKGCPLEPSRGG